MKLIATLQTSGRPQANTRAVIFRIEDVSSDDSALLTRYGHPRIDFARGDEAKNARIWRGEAQVVWFDSPSDAQAHIDEIGLLFAAEIKRLRERWTQDGFASNTTVVDA